MSSEQEHKCVFCNETFPTKEELQTHFRKHADPHFNQKKIKSRSQDEADVSEKPKSQPEMVECDVCPEVFTTISKAITHKHKVHPDHDTKYFCPWCGKLFTMKHLYNKHIQATHSSEQKAESNSHCDSCDVDFNNPTAIAYHNKFFHRQEELPAIGHSKKLKMILQEIVQIFYCPFCGEEYDNKVNLHKHMIDDHSDENQSPDDVFRCPLCDAIFYHLDAYELHLTYHSIEDLYTERSELMDEITDFSLESVPPLQEKVENVESEHKDDSNAIGIEQLLEFTMDDSTDNRKSKKHKKHKKSKKAAITLDEFLNMNKDVFGEGIDIQGIEEVPSQVVAKSFKPKRPIPTKVNSSDIAKLKRHGIVVKKQAIKTGKPVINSKQVTNPILKTLKNVCPAPKQQTKVNTLVSTDDVLSKLLTQGSQIKIVKKSNQDKEDHIQQDQEAEKSPNHIEETSNGGHKTDMDVSNDIDKTNDHEDIDVNNPISHSIKHISNINSPISEREDANNDHHPETLESLNKECGSAEYNDEIDESQCQSQNSTNTVNSLNVLRNNSNTAIKLSEQNIIESKDMRPENEINSGHAVSQTSELNVQENETLQDTTSDKALDSLKHINDSFTIKPVNQPQTQAPKETKPRNGVENNRFKASQYNVHDKIDTSNLSKLKNLDGITIKSTTQSSLIKNKHVTDGEESAEERETVEERDEESSVEQKNKINKEKNAHARTPSHTTKNAFKTTQKDSLKRILINENSQSNMDLLKNLKNVTAKTINVINQNIQTPMFSPNCTKMIPLSKSSIQKEITEDGIEIFNIEDSDSDEANSDKISDGICNNKNTSNESKQETHKSIEVSKNINKNISIKSTNQQFNTICKEKHSYKDKSKDFIENDNTPDNSKKKDVSLNKLDSSKSNQKHIAINNVLKHLSKNITVKSRNSSPNQLIQSEEHNTNDSHFESNETDSDTDTPLSRLKIKEIENTSEDEFTEEPGNDIPQENVKIEHPDDSHSDHDDEEPMDDEFSDTSDIESKISSTTVQKSSENSRQNSNLNNSKNCNRNITMKFDKPTSTVKSENSLQSEEIPLFAKNLSSQISIKHIKRPENSKTINIKPVEESATNSNETSVNEKIASKNQVNTFNKEVKTVKTFQTQTKTVIQEITTTVTKTIKTVNQTTQQEVRNMSQTSSATLPPKMQGMNTNINVSQKSFHGVKVRQSMPNIRPKLRGLAPQTMRPAMQQMRPVSGTPIRTCNQLVPVRPAQNRPNGPRPRMPNVFNIRASMSQQQKPQIGRQVKVAPGAVVSSPKRPVEATGPFSCFKKPKESLIPVPDFPLVNKNDGESSQFSSTMHMSKSNFSSSTKTVRGDSVVTSTQMKSEMSASSQQLSKLRNMSGLSVVKTSQAKQTQVEEKTEMSASKRSTLEAIQKLQNQGLLVKKPRLEESDDSDNSVPDGDNVKHNSEEEFNE